MRPATLPLLLVLALLAVPLVERLAFVTPGVGVVTPGVAIATMDRGPMGRERIVTPGVADATMARGPMGRDEPGSRPIAATAAAGMTGSGTAAAGMPGPSPQPLEQVTILPPLPGQPSSRPLTRAEALAAVIRSPEYQDTVPPLARLYFATFGRYPDYEGLNYYTGVREGGMTLAEIAQEFAHGREFSIRYGSLDNHEFVEQLFANVLGNTHQADVRAYWVGELDSGRMTRGQVIVDLSESGAFRERSANRVFVSTAYSEIFQRTPEPNTYAHWVGLLDQGHPRRTVIDGLLRGR